MDKSFHNENTFVLVSEEDYLDEIEELRGRYKKLNDIHTKLEQRHRELLKLMNELLKIKSEDNDIVNLDEIRCKITKVLYNEIRRHTSFPFTPILSQVFCSYNNLTKQNNIDYNADMTVD
jgi:hypothetical protein